ncbi:hypothetical protein AB751O23_AR_00100 [Chlamydiales bacterium SCGC AB-751-O23]|nr:hypothetical protein AB751O23_AR_00100 [Chlamydiales bacterium SCGC AB-751-O23]
MANGRHLSKGGSFLLANERSFFASLDRYSKSRPNRTNLFDEEARSRFSRGASFVASNAEEDVDLARSLEQHNIYRVAFFYLQRMLYSQSSIVDIVESRVPLQSKSKDVKRNDTDEEAHSSIVPTTEDEIEAQTRLFNKSRVIGFGSVLEVLLSRTIMLPQFVNHEVDSLADNMKGDVLELLKALNLPDNDVKIKTEKVISSLKKRTSSKLGKLQRDGGSSSSQILEVYPLVLQNIEGKISFDELKLIIAKEVVLMKQEDLESLSAFNVVLSETIGSVYQYCESTIKERLRVLLKTKKLDLGSNEEIQEAFKQECLKLPTEFQLVLGKLATLYKIEMQKAKVVELLQVQDRVLGEMMLELKNSSGSDWIISLLGKLEGSSNLSRMVASDLDKSSKEFTSGLISKKFIKEIGASRPVYECKICVDGAIKSLQEKVDLFSNPVSAGMRVALSGLRNLLEENDTGVIKESLKHILNTSLKVDDLFVLLESREPGIREEKKGVDLLDKFGVFVKLLNNESYENVLEVKKGKRDKLLERFDRESTQIKSANEVIEDFEKRGELAFLKEKLEKACNGIEKNKIIQDVCYAFPCDQDILGAIENLKLAIGKADEYKVDHQGVLLKIDEEAKLVTSSSGSAL